MNPFEKLHAALKRRFAPAGSNSRLGLVDEAMQAADSVARALSSSGYRADFSVASLRELDRFFDEHTEGGKPKAGGLLEDRRGQRLFAIGAYCGEVIRRQVGGTWTTDEDDPNAEINIVLVLPDGSVLWPVQRVMKRFTHGSEEGLYAYSLALLRDFG